jgi:hypothetical protein
MTRTARTVVATAVVAVFIPFLSFPRPLEAASDPRSLTPRLRPADLEMREIVRLGRDLSPTLAALFTRIEATDVVVYMKCARLSARVDGQLTFLSSVAGLRYVLVEIACDRGEIRRLSTLGHELQHAVEIAESPSIVDEASLGRAYADFGVQRDRTASVRAYDTRAAIHIGEQVWKEITGAAAADD